MIIPANSYMGKVKKILEFNLELHTLTGKDEKLKT